MADISSSIRIEDGFTEPLKNLAKAAWDVESAATAVTKSLVSQEDEINSISDRLKNYTTEFSKAFGLHSLLTIQNLSSGFPKLFEGASKSIDLFSKTAKVNMWALEERIGTTIQATSKAFHTYKMSFDAFGTRIYSARLAARSFSKVMSNDFLISFTRPKAAVEKLSSSIGTFKNDFSKFAKANFWSTLSSMRWNAINKVSMGAFHKMKDSYIRGFNSLMESIGKSIDEINIGDKLHAQFGEAGDVARKRSYELANEIGESATMVSELAMKAGQEGIGTEHFERMMKLADKVGKLRQGETTESAANTLMSNIKSGHDASSLAQLYGGGEKMERQLRRAGYERALNHGDLNKALEIAEKIAEQAGLTDENYNKATNNLSQNYKKIMNTIDNVKKRLAETFNRTFAPTIEKIKKLLESNAFKTVVNVADWLMEKLGKFLNWFTESAVDNIHIIGVLLGVGIVSKVAFLFPMIKGIFALITGSPAAIASVAGFVTKIGTKLVAMKGPIGFLAKNIALYGGKLVAIIKAQALVIKQKGIMALKDAALAKLKVAGPWMLAGAAVAGITYGVYKLSGSSKSFTEWLKDKLKTFSHIMASGYKFLQNVFTNVFIFFDRVADYITNLPNLATAAFQDILDELEELKKKVKGEEISYKVYVDADEYKKMTEKEREALGIKYTETVKLTQDEVSDWIRGIGDARKKFTDIFQTEDGSWVGNKKYYMTDKRKSNVDEVLEKIRDNQLQYINVWEGTDKALEEGWAVAADWLKKIFNQGEEQAKTESGIKTDTDNIRKFNEQEEELGWMKAFSDRQIMSGYGSMTTTINNRTINQNGVSDNVMAETYRRDRSTIPGRSRRYRS